MIIRLSVRSILYFWDMVWHIVVFVVSIQILIQLQNALIIYFIYLLNFCPDMYPFLIVGVSVEMADQV